MLEHLDAKGLSVPVAPVVPLPVPAAKTPNRVSEKAQTSTTPTAVTLRIGLPLACLSIWSNIVL